ncbi:MAG: polyhydroxyalkanoate synthesis repressor PhaR [Azoarcus sp.]|jgi:polyhydroxyalkanoate synthesis repressor PhaR|nr:polyhydroxyalkanoate synthesis repressor PhaR [Azoarcus sp.]
MGEQTRLIKKYPNRRLYDTRTSAYITLCDIKDLVLGHEDFLVVDAKSGEDLTRSILLQIILEEEAGGMPMFTSDLLSHMIRFYGNAMQGMMGKYLENNIRSFSEMHAKLQEQARGIYGENNTISQDLWAQFLNFQGPALQNMMGTYVEQSQKMFQQIQEQVESQTRNMFTGFQFPAHASPSSSLSKGGEKNLPVPVTAPARPRNKS